MKTIHVLSAFSLLLRGGLKVDVPAGVQTVADEVAEHWYTQGFLAHGGLGSKEYAEAAWGAVNTAFHKADEAIREYEQLLKASAEADDAAGIEDRVPPHLASDRRYDDGSPKAVASDVAVDALDHDHDGRPGGSLPDGYRWADDGLGGGDAIVDATGTVVARTADELQAMLAGDEADDQASGGPADDGGKGNQGNDEKPATRTAEDLATKTDDELRTMIKERDGKAPNGRLGREKLLALALAPAGDEADDQA